ncbi:NAD-dependent epimerase/dehydratase family protein [Salinibaculum marinum]
MEAIDRNEQGSVIVVNDEERLVGTVTDGDIRRGILDGLDLDASVRRVLTEDPVYIRNSWPEADFMSNLPLQKVRERAGSSGTLLIPVLDENDRVIDARNVSVTGDGIEERPAVRNGINRVLVIGGAGYLGSTLCRQLLDEGYEVNVLDNLLYGNHGIRSLTAHDRFSFTQGDMRNIETVTQAICGVDAVIYLAALVGDPASSIDTQKTLEMNYHAATMAARLCDYHQVNRFFFASTCSVYGRTEDESSLLTEESKLNPLSLYTKTKINSEKAILELADNTFHPTVLRMATVYGLSPRMRFDLVVNILAAKAYNKGEIPIFGGNQYRPNIHVADATRAFIACLESPIEEVSGEVFNVGSNEQNYRIKEIGAIVSECFPQAEIEPYPEEEDERSYRVDFSKIRETVDYETQRTIRGAVNEIKEAFENGKFDDFTDKRYHNYKSLQDGDSVSRSAAGN